MDVVPEADIAASTVLEIDMKGVADVATMRA
jgi:hypothetical protein